MAQEAEAALNSLDKASLGELKSFGSPAAEIVQVVAACMILCASNGVIPKDLSLVPSCHSCIMLCGWVVGGAGGAVRHRSCQVQFADH